MIVNDELWFIQGISVFLVKKPSKISESRTKKGLPRFGPSFCVTLRMDGTPHGQGGPWGSGSWSAHWKKPHWFCPHLWKVLPWLGPSFLTVKVNDGWPHAQAGPGGSWAPVGKPGVPLAGAAPRGGSSAHSKKEQGWSGCCLAHLKNPRPWLGPSFFTFKKMAGCPQAQFRESALGANWSCASKGPGGCWLKAGTWP